MQEWNTLAQRMILGSDANPAPFTSDRSELQTFFASLQALPPQQQLLQALAGLQWLRKLGAPFRHEAINPTAVPEECATASSAVGALIQTGLQARQTALLAEVFEALAQHQLQVAPELLVDCLQLATAQPELRVLMPLVCGKRGQQLAQWNSAWQFALTTDVSTLEGDALARHLALLRNRDHSAFQTLLTSLWSTLAAKDRQKIAALLATNPRQEDAPFLIECLSDRSLPVRQLATQTLAQLQDPTLIAHLQAIITRFVRMKPARLLRKGQLDVELPESFDKQWERYGIQENLEYSELGGKLGRKSSWLQQWLALLPPIVLLDTLQCRGDEYLKLAAQSDHSDVLLTGLANAALLHDDAEALAALWQLSTPKQQQQWHAPALNRARHHCREWLLTQLLDQADETPEKLCTVVFHLQRQHPPSRQFSQRLRPLLLTLVDQLPYWHQGHQQRLDELAFALDVADISDWISTLQTNTPARLENCLRWLHCRQQLHQELPS